MQLRAAAVGVVLVVALGAGGMALWQARDNAPEVTGAHMDAATVAGLGPSGIERVEGDLRPRLPPQGPDLTIRVAQIRAELESLSRDRAPRAWGLKQIELAYAFQERRIIEHTSDYAPGVAAAEAALSVFGKVRDPVEWAHARMLRAALLDPDQFAYEVSPEAARQAEADAAAALSVFTRQKYPLQYLEVRCRRWETAYSRSLETVRQSREEPTPRVVLKPVCRPLVRHNGYGDAEISEPQSARDTILSLGLLRSAPPLMGAQVGSRVGNTLAQAIAKIPDLQAKLVTFGITQSDLRSFDDLDDLELGLAVFEGRAPALSSTLAMDDLGLTPEVRRKLLALRARADAAAAMSGRSGPEWRANKTMWAAYAEIFDTIVDLPTVPPATRPSHVATIAPALIDKDRGFVGSLPARGLARLSRTPGDWPLATYQQRNGSVRIGANLEDTNVEGLRGRISGARDSVKAWMDRYRAKDFAGGIAEFRAAFEPKWSPVLREAIAKAGVAPGGRVLVLPDGAASMLPIGLLRDPRTGRALAEDYELVYAPSLDAYDRSIRRAAERRPMTLTVIDPGETVTGLASTDGEIAMVGHHFPGARHPLTANKTEILRALAQSSYWHFATHGSFDAAAPRNSWVMVGKDDFLTLGDLYAAEEPLGAPRLVVLSACETGLFDAERDPNEFIGLPTGFLQAGAAGVIASLWQVSDAATTLLMARFYDLHMQGGLAPPTALRNAQTWLKEADRATLSAYALAQQKSGVLTHDQASELLTAIAQSESARPYADPVYWGAFVYYGA